MALKNRFASRKRLGSSGLTLIETIVALAIFAICIGGYCALVTQVRQAADMARDRYIAVNIAKNRMERARSFDYDQLHLFVDSGVILDDDGNPDIDGNFQRTTSVSNVTDSLSLISIKIEVRDRITRKFDDDPEVIQTYLTDYLEPPE
ncbi:MAG: prepilin-type N-terminal cleavage/methylation domain-containing protein [Kiritimatiellia bacterium]|jgi:type II secretion system protein I|nr:prepilin-type N-terminal cleavage/methylation domain-containing protein [Kiritimatiellia bacterium]